MVNKVFFIRGWYASSFIIDDFELKFLDSDSTKNVKNFKEAFSKKLSFSRKFYIEYNDIKSIRQEDNDKIVRIKYKVLLLFSYEYSFSFSNSNNAKIFFDFFEKELYYTKIHETLSPFKAIKSYLIRFIMILGFLIFSYFRALGIEQGIFELKGKVSRYNKMLDSLGHKGVFFIGVIICSYFVYKIWTRFRNPPSQIKFLPPYE